MDLRAHARYSMMVARRLTEKIVSSFGSDREWLFQVHPQANHPLWIVGHLGLADNNFLSKFRTESANKPDGWEERFWFGSTPTSDPGYYPDPPVVLEYFRERRATLLKVFEELSDEELAAPAPAPTERSPIAGAPCLGHWFLFAAYHEGIHFGQLTVAHRGLGNEPMLRPRRPS